MKRTYIFCTSEYSSDDERFTVLSAREVLNIINSNVVIIVSGDNMIDNYEMFKIIYKVANKGNRVYVIGSGLNAEYAKKVYCLAVAKSIYNIYSVDSLDVIDSEYIESILSKENTIQDIENYIGSDVVFSETIGTILLEIINRCKDGDDEGLLDYIKQNLDILSNSVYYNDCMRSINDKLTNDVESLKVARDGVLDEYTKIKKDSADKDSEISDLKDKIEVFKKDLASIKQENEMIVGQLNNQGPTVSNFQQIHTATLARCKTKSILYFKEVTYVRYVNSLIVQMIKMISMAGMKLNIRLVIFDNKSDFSMIYKPLNILTLQDYLQNKDRVLKTNEMVVVDPNHVIIEDILKMPHDLLIIYDRLRLEKDIVHGNNVFKYWVLNSADTYNKLKSDIKDSKYVVTRPGVLDECIAIPEIAEYRESSDSAKSMKYRALLNASSAPEGTIVENILKRAGIILPRRR